MHLRSDRLRPWAPADAPFLAAAWADPHVTRWNPSPPAVMGVGVAEDPLGAARRWIAGAAERWEAGISHDLVVIDPDGFPVGEVGLTTPTPIAAGGVRAELGVWIAGSRIREGHASSAVVAMAEVAATELGIDQLWCRTHLGNEPAVGLFSSLGWHHVGDRGAFAIWSAPASLLG